MFTIDEPTIKLGIIGPVKSSQLENILHAAINEGNGHLYDLWNLIDCAKYTFAVSYKHASNKGIRMDPSRIQGLANVVRRELRGDPPIYFWIDRIARTRLAAETVNWGNLGLAPYSLFRTVLAPQWHSCLIQEEHTRMWLRMEAVLSACCQGYFVPVIEESASSLLQNFRGVLGPSQSGRYIGMRYLPEDALKELAVSIICGNWDVSGTSFPQDKIDARDWASKTTATLERDPFVLKTVERMVMRQVFANDLPITGKLWKRPSAIGIKSAARARGANLLHPPIQNLGPRVASYSNVTGKTVVLITDLGVAAVSVDDCGWSLPVGHCAVVDNFSEQHLTGQVKRVTSLNASGPMTSLFYTIFETKYPRDNPAEIHDPREKAILKRAQLRPTAIEMAKLVLRTERDPTVRKVLIVDTDHIRFTS